MEKEIKLATAKHPELVEFKSFDAFMELRMSDENNNWYQNDFKLIVGELANGKDGFMVFKDNDLLLKFEEGFPKKYGTISKPSKNDDNNIMTFVFNTIEEKTNMLIASFVTPN